MKFDINQAFSEKKRNLSRMSTFSQISIIERHFRFNIVNVGDLLFKLQHNGESGKSIELTKLVLVNISDLIRNLKLIKSHTKRD